MYDCSGECGEYRRGLELVTRLGEPGMVVETKLERSHLMLDGEAVAQAPATVSHARHAPVHSRPFPPTTMGVYMYSIHAASLVAGILCPICLLPMREIH